MKKYILLFIVVWGFLFTTSCLSDYLDKAPESGLEEEQVFSNLENFKLYFDAVYNGQKYYNGSYRDSYNIKNAFAVYFDFWDQKYGWESVTDCVDNGRYMEGHAWKSGNMSETIVNKMTYDGARRPILESMFLCIRVCNRALPRIDDIQDATDIDKNDLKGQAHFIRALAHFTLFKIWGPMPYQTRAMDEDDVWDIPRLSKHETCIRIAADFDSAAYYFRKAGLMRRDPLPGVSGSLNYGTYQLHRPNGMAALGMKSRVLLYAASPLNNELGLTDWDNAAKAAWHAMLCARDTFKVSLETMGNRYRNYVSVAICQESLWTWSTGSQGWNSGNFATWFCGQFGNSASSWSGMCPTQNWVDKYETKYGEPLNTETDRAAAATAGHFKEQDPYANRDPRLAADVIVNQGPAASWTDGKAQLWYNSSTSYGELRDPGFLGRTYTGYYMRKFWGSNSQSASRKKQSSYTYSDPVIRLIELYLNYAEAANEAYGPGVIPSYATKSALTVLNEVRSRSGLAMPAVQAAYTGSTDALRPRIKNERNVELSFEGHYYNDIRRWMDLRETQFFPLWGVDIKKVPVTADYTTGFMYTREMLPADRQPAWKPTMYYLPFNNSDYFKMKSFEPNPVW